MMDEINSETISRSRLIGIVFSIVGLLIIGQLIHLQVFPYREDVLSGAEIGKGEWRTIIPPRGEIFDRWGYLLAGNCQVFEVGIDITLVKSPEIIASTLNLVLGLDYSAVLSIAELKKEESDLINHVVARNVLPETAERLRGLVKELEENRLIEGPEAPSLEGLTLIPKLVRCYPEGSLFSPGLGFVVGDKDGTFGIEEYYDDFLSNPAQRVWLPSLPYQVEQWPESSSASGLILTIDRDLQAEVESILDIAVQENGAESGAILVLDPRNGEVLAMASTPRLNLKTYWEYEEIFPKDATFNRPISAVYEPGSVFKVLTMAAALDSGTVTPETTFFDNGWIEIGGAVITNWNNDAWGLQTMLGCMQHSLNVCLTHVAKLMGPDVFYSYLKKFGIGQRTGVDLAMEASGKLRLPNQEGWYLVDLGTNSFGQGVAVTPLQLAVAISAVANGGNMMAPHVVRAIVDQGIQYTTPMLVLGQPISAETARTLTDMLTRSLEEESSSALVTGYQVAGKTGTAEIPTPTGYTSGVTNASFVGWGPVDAPRFLVYIWLEKPTSSPWGSVVAAPVFRQVVERLVVHLELPPDDIRAQLTGQ
ncbi:MAG: penicillin-binding protein 2 [Chloroflexota bacterium]